MASGITPELLLRVYREGIFPMAETRDSPEVFWVDPRSRGILPLDAFHISRSLRRRIRQARFNVTLDTDFTGVVRGCAGRPETWINDEIFSLYIALHRMGHAHSVEVRADGALIGGVYGIRIGAAFFGESMFSEQRDASKLALAWLVARLRAGGFVLFDTQFVSAHLESLGGVAIPRAEYHRRLRDAVGRDADFFRQSACVSPDEVLHVITQTS